MLSTCFVLLILINLAPPRLYLVESIKCYESGRNGTKTTEKTCNTTMDSCIRYDLTIGSHYTEKQACAVSLGKKNACERAKSSLDVWREDTKVVDKWRPITRLEDMPITGMPTNPNTPEVLEEARRADDDRQELMFIFALAAAYGQPVRIEDQMAIINAYNSHHRAATDEPSAGKLGKPVNVGNMLKNCVACKTDLCNVSRGSAKTVIVILAFIPFIVAVSI